MLLSPVHFWTSPDVPFCWGEGGRFSSLGYTGCPEWKQIVHLWLMLSLLSVQWNLRSWREWSFFYPGLDKNRCSFFICRLMQIKLWNSTIRKAFLLEKETVLRANDSAWSGIRFHLEFLAGWSGAFVLHVCLVQSKMKNILFRWDEDRQPRSLFFCFMFPISSFYVGQQHWFEPRTKHRIFLLMIGIHCIVVLAVSTTLSPFPLTERRNSLLKWLGMMCFWSKCWVPKEMPCIDHPHPIVSRRNSKQEISCLCVIFSVLWWLALKHSNPSESELPGNVHDTKEKIWVLLEVDSNTKHHSGSISIVWRQLRRYKTVVAETFWRLETRNRQKMPLVEERRFAQTLRTLWHCGLLMMTGNVESLGIFPVN